MVVRHVLLRYLYLKTNKLVKEIDQVGISEEKRNEENGSFGNETKTGNGEVGMLRRLTVFVKKQGDDDGEG